MKSNNTITRDNYEAYMVDYWDGNLTPDLTVELLRFLDSNPDIKKEAMDAGQFTISPENMLFDAKQEILKKEISKENIDEFLVAELEHELLPHEQNELSLFLASNPQYIRDRKLYALTKLHPDTSLRYPNKRGLKKGAMMPLWIRYSSVAAAACLFLGIGIWFYNQPPTVVVVNNPKTIIQPESIQPAISLIETPKADAPIIKNNPLPHNTSVIPVLAVTDKKKHEVEPIASINNASENFYTYSKNRKPGDYLEALVNSYVPSQKYIITNAPEEANAPEPEVKTPNTNKTLDDAMNGFANKSLDRIIKDTALTQEMKNSNYSIQTKVAKAIAWATGKVSKGKVKVEAIPNLDGSLATMSFTNGKYNYTKRF
jgi:hypothetical protein